MEEETLRDKSVNSMKVAMMNFDRAEFDAVFNELWLQYDFTAIFTNFFIPLMRDIGQLWQTGTINPAHEHFVSSLIKQKVLLATEKLGRPEKYKTSHRFVLFLPDNEVHDLGICFLNYEIARKGFQAIYLGQSVPIKSLEVFQKPVEANLVFISYFTMKPDVNKLDAYLNSFQTKILNESNSELWLLGRRALEVKSNPPDRVRVFKSIEELIIHFSD